MMNKKAYRIPNSIQERTIHLTDDISTLITTALRNDSTTKNNTFGETEDVLNRTVGMENILLMVRLHSLCKFMLTSISF